MIETKNIVNKRRIPFISSQIDLTWPRKTRLKILPKKFLNKNAKKKKQNRIYNIFSKDNFKRYN